MKVMLRYSEVDFSLLEENIFYTMEKKKLNLFFGPIVR
jgi:hypothetical protein